MDVTQYGLDTVVRKVYLERPIQDPRRQAVRYPQLSLSLSHGAHSTLHLLTGFGVPSAANAPSSATGIEHGIW